MRQAALPSVMIDAQRGTSPALTRRPIADNDDGRDDARRQEEFERICARELLSDSD